MYNSAISFSLSQPSKGEVGQISKALQLHVLIVPRAHASKYKSLKSSTWGYVYSKANKTKGTSIPTNKSQIKSCRVLFFNWHKRSKGSPYYSSDPFWKYSQIWPLYLPQCFGRCVVEMINLPRSVVSLGEAMYQTVSLEFRLNTE